MIDDVVLCIEEAATNAIRHSGVEQPIELSLYFEGGEPTLAYPVMLAAARHARERGLDFGVELLVRDGNALVHPLRSQHFASSYSCVIRSLRRRRLPLLLKCVAYALTVGGTFQSVPN